MSTKNCHPCLDMEDFAAAPPSLFIDEGFQSVTISDNHRIQVLRQHGWATCAVWVQVNSLIPGALPLITRVTLLLLIASIIACQCCSIGTGLTSTINSTGSGAGQLRCPTLVLPMMAMGALSSVLPGSSCPPLASYFIKLTHEAARYHFQIVFRRSSSSSSSSSNIFYMVRCVRVCKNCKPCTSNILNIVQISMRRESISGGGGSRTRLVDPSTPGS